MERIIRPNLFRVCRILADSVFKNILNRASGGDLGAAAGNSIIPHAENITGAPPGGDILGVWGL